MNKKMFLFAAAFGVAAFVGLTAFDGENDQQAEIEAAIEQQLNDFRSEKQMECQTSALAAAQAKADSVLAAKPGKPAPVQKVVATPTKPAPAKPKPTATKPTTPVAPPPPPPAKPEPPKTTGNGKPALGGDQAPGTTGNGKPALGGEPATTSDGKTTVGSGKPKLGGN